MLGMTFLFPLQILDSIFLLGDSLPRFYLLETLTASQLHLPEAVKDRLCWGVSANRWVVLMMNLVLCFSKPLLAAQGVETGSSNLKTLSLTTPAQQRDPKSKSRR